MKLYKVAISVVFVLLFSATSKASVNYEGQSTGYVYGSSSVSTNQPYNTSGQVLLAVVNVLNVTTIEEASFVHPSVLSAPSGWTEIVSNTFYGIGTYRAVWYKIATGSTASQTWGFDFPLRGQVSILAYSGVDTTYPINAYSFKNDWMLGTNHTANAVTTDYANCLIVASWFSVDTGIGFYDSTSPSNTRINFAGISQQAQRPMLVADEVQASAGASGNKTGTTDNNSYCQAIMVALKPGT